MSDLAEALRVDPSTATRAIQRLEKAGLAERKPSTADGRVVEVAITDAGRVRHQIVAERRAELMTFIMRQYGRAELPVFAEMLERFVVAADEFVATATRCPTDPTTATTARPPRRRPSRPACPRPVHVIARRQIGFVAA